MADNPKHSAKKTYEVGAEEGTTEAAFLNKLNKNMALVFSHLGRMKPDHNAISQWKYHCP